MDSHSTCQLAWRSLPAREDHPINCKDDPVAQQWPAPLLCPDKHPAKKDIIEAPLSRSLTRQYVGCIHWMHQASLFFHECGSLRIHNILFEVAIPIRCMLSRPMEVPCCSTIRHTSGMARTRMLRPNGAGEPSRQFVIVWCLVCILDDI